ncbi:MAG: SUMF1/EgtB/PvdO family nonheme iron enzyme, partial [Treponema sp.]|nr:SUMF1/EgtB/PvdO family nonheme iron enzyme [Treponema sp.]
TADITLYAKWSTVTYTVTFDTNGGSAAPEAQTVAEGSKATEPAAPTKADYIFGGWFREAGLINLWNFATDTVTADITFYARWIPLPFKMVNVPVPGVGLTFPTGEYDNGTATVAAAYEIGETEVTYELWYTVREWAEINKDYTFYDDYSPWYDIPGWEGSSPPGGIGNTPPTGNKQEPVTMVTWFDAAVWLNALTEWVNANTGSSLEPVYYDGTSVAKDSSPSSNFVREETATGFRLPTSNEWELTARWRGNDTANTVSNATFTAAPWFTKGNSASGATAAYTDSTETDRVAWYNGNASGKTQRVGQKAANTLGLYGMSGNVEEWCDDWDPYNIGTFRIKRGGSWNSSADDLRVGLVNPDYPTSQLNGNGIRPARNAQ